MEMEREEAERKGRQEGREIAVTSRGRLCSSSRRLRELVCCRIEVKGCEGYPGSWVPLLAGTDDIQTDGFPSNPAGKWKKTKALPTRVVFKTTSRRRLRAEVRAGLLHLPDLWLAAHNS